MYWFLLESAAGYAVFEVTAAEEIGSSSEQVQQQMADFASFSRGIKMVGFRPFETSEVALDNCLKVSEGELTTELHTFLEATLPEGVSLKKEKERFLGVMDPKLASAIQDTLQFPCRSNEMIHELVRGARTHWSRMVKGLTQVSGETMERSAQLGLGHAYSRARVKFNVNRQDNMIIQAIQLLDQLDKDVNTNAMRAKEWYGWHFPELAKLVGDVFQYSRLINVIQDKSQFLSTATGATEEEMLDKLNKVVLDEEVAKRVLDAMRSSMGFDVSQIDLTNISNFATRVEQLSKYRMELSEYLRTKMTDCAPNIHALLGETVGARLIAHAGSLTKLSKCPASTVQILGAEKALFRALKSKGNTPKFGLLFNSTFISRATTKNKGRISRFLANKCAIASRLDAFSDAPNAIYGDKLRAQVEERLQFYETGQVPRKNLEVMLEAKEEMDAKLKKAGKKEKKKKTEEVAVEVEEPKKEKKKARKHEEVEAEAEEAPKSSKKSKKAKVVEEEEAAEEEAPKSSSKKDKKKKREE